MRRARRCLPKHKPFAKSTVPPSHAQLAAGTMDSAGKSDSLALKLYEACEKGNEGAVRRLARSIVSDMTQDVSASPPTQQQRRVARRSSRQAEADRARSLSRGRS